VKLISDNARELGALLRHDPDTLALLNSLPEGFAAANDSKAVVWLERLAAEMHWLAQGPSFRTPVLANGGQGGRAPQDYYIRQIAETICAYTWKFECPAVEGKRPRFPYAKAQEWLRAVLEDRGLEASNSLETLIRQGAKEFADKDMTKFNMSNLIPDSLPPA
jgi:hypothetical protein